MGWTWWLGWGAGGDRLYPSSPLPFLLALSSAPMPTFKTHSVLSLQSESFWSLSGAPFGFIPVLKLGVLLPLLVRLESDRRCSGGKRMARGKCDHPFHTSPQ